MKKSSPLLWIALAGAGLYFFMKYKKNAEEGEEKVTPGAEELEAAGTGIDETPGEGGGGIPGAIKMVASTVDEVKNVLSQAKATVESGKAQAVEVSTPSGTVTVAKKSFLAKLKAKRKAKAEARKIKRAEVKAKRTARRKARRLKRKKNAA